MRTDPAAIFIHQPQSADVTALWATIVDGFGQEPVTEGARTRAQGLELVQRLCE